MKPLTLEQKPSASSISPGSAIKNFLPFLLALFLIAVVLQVDLFLAILYFLAAVYVLSRLWVGQMMPSLRVGRRFVGRAFHGEKVAVELTVNNTGRLPILWLEVHESMPVSLVSPPFYREVISLSPREQRTLRYELTGRRRGYYSIGPLRLRSGGVFGVHSNFISEVAPTHLIVYPQVLPLQQLGLPTHSPLVALTARSPLFEDPSWVMGVRDYQRGDSPRRIHWTATASAGRLLVKQYRPSIARETLIFVDMNRDGYEVDQRFTAPELAIVTAASIANHVVTLDKLPAGLATEGLDPLTETVVRFFLPPRSGRAQLMNMLEVLARVEVESVTPMPELLRREGVQLSWGATLVVITGKETDELFSTLVYLRRTGFAVTLVLVQPGKPSAELRQRAALMGVSVCQVWRERDLRAGLGEPALGVRP